MKFYIKHPIDDNDPSKILDVILLGDVLLAAKTISKQFPAENLTVWALGRARYVLNGGELGQDISDLTTYFHFDDDDEEGPQLLKEWAEVIADTQEFNEDDF